MEFQRTIKWGLGGALPGLALVALAWPVEPELDLLLGVGGAVVALLGAIIGVRASSETDRMARRRIVVGSVVGASVGLLLFVVQPVVGAVLAAVGAIVGSNYGRHTGHGGHMNLRRT